MKRISMIVLSAAAVTLLAACAGTPPPSPVPPSVGVVCNASRVQFAVGRPLTSNLENEARLRSGAGMVRVIWPGQVVTMEYNERRLNIEVDAAGRVIRVRCG
jgi:hypothetical protein